MQSARAQWGFWQADSLLAEGRLAPAESAYYAGLRVAPRDPTKRAALGRFLAARGGVRAGAVLLEEAQFFGGDSAALARALVPLYLRLRDFRALYDLKPGVISSAERRRATWLVNRPSDARLRDTDVLLSYKPIDRKSTRLNSSHSQISYAVFCLKKKKLTTKYTTNRAESQYHIYRRL